jgi:hypothetical protein
MAHSLEVQEGLLTSFCILASRKGKREGEACLFALKAYTKDLSHKLKIIHLILHTFAQMGIHIHVHCKDILFCV